MNKHLKCSKKKCEWEGLESDLVQLVDTALSKKLGVTIRNSVCPKCGCKYFYPLKNYDDK